jgi:hypothetical protein
MDSQQISLGTRLRVENGKSRVLVPRGRAENDFELLFEGSKDACEEFLLRKVEEEFPGLLTG